MIPTKVEISSKTIIFTVFFLMVLKFVWIIRDLLFSLFIALIIVSALKPIVAFLEKKRIPRLLGSIVVYFLFLFLIGNAVGLIFPPLIKETIHLLRNLPEMIRNGPPYISTLINVEMLGQYIPDISNQLLDIIKLVFTNALFIISTIFFGFYLLLEENAIKKILLKFFDEKELRTPFSIIEKVEKRLNAWFWGEIVLMTVIGIMTFIGLNLIGMKYTLAIAVLAGFLEVVPTLGPVTTGIIAAVIGFAQSYYLGFANIALCFVIQQLENNLIVPFVMQKAVGLNPIATLIALIIGGKLAGVMGVLLAVPIMLFMETVLIAVIKTKKVNA